MRANVTEKMEAKVNDVMVSLGQVKLDAEMGVKLSEEIGA
jgi:hypothetical protein